jgi:hypothetical protein
MSEITIARVVNVSVSNPQAGVGAYNTSNLAIFTHETPAGSFGVAGFKLYVDPTDVGTDFGTGTKTYAMALSVFGQKPNIRAGGGQLVVILMDNVVAPVVAVQHIAFSTVPTVGGCNFVYGGEEAAYAFGDTAGDLQTALQALTGLGTVTVTGNSTTGFNVTFTGVSGPVPELTTNGNTMQDTDGYNVFPTVTTTTPGVAAVAVEPLDAAITRTKSLVQYFGVMQSDPVATITESVMDAAAAVIQSLNKIAFFVSYTEADIESGGMLDDLRTSNYHQSRGLYYGDNTGNAAIEYMAAYASRLLSVNFSGSRTTITMHLKDLLGIDPDPSMTETIYNKAEAAGVDIYASIQGVPKVVSFGGNDFADQVYNQLWFVGALQVAGFNYLATTDTKVVQTEEGMDGLKGAYRAVCEQAVTNQYSAPGTWTSPTSFGNLGDFLDNITQRGYYIYSLPVGQQSQADREDRKAPLCQIALKEAGAIHSSEVIVNINR